MKSESVAIIDYGMGNLHSVASAVHKVAPQVKVRVTSDARAITGADRVILPGVGAIRDCMTEIRRLGLNDVVTAVIDSGKPLLAVCVGLQTLMESSEENGGVECLGYFKGPVRNFSGNADFGRQSDESSSSGERLKVPHMGWNQVSQRVTHPLWQHIPDNSRFYFVHSYYVDAAQPQNIVGSCQYGIEFSAALARDNVFAAQFHPEKSHDHGLQLLQNFIGWDGRPD